jgi:hypothetical protein
MNDLFIQYGVQAAGGPAFLRRERTAVGQLQTRTRTGYTYSQPQASTRTGSQSCTTTTTYQQTQACYQDGFSNQYSSYSECAAVCTQWGCQDANPYNCANQFRQCIDTQQTTSRTCDSSGFLMTWQCYWYQEPVYNTTCGPCTFSAWSGYFNVSSCSATYPGCSNGAVQRQCQTVTACAWNAYSAWSNVTSCSAVSPACSNGAFQRDCQTVYSWGDWSAYEEADVCVPQSPTPSAGAVEIECVAI